MRASASTGPGLVVLGVDPGLRATGWGVLAVGGGDAGPAERREPRVLGYGAVVTEAGAPLPERLWRILLGLREVVGRWQPAEVAVEEAFVAANRRVAITMGEARGVVLLAAAEAGLPVFEYSASEVKQAVSGYGRGSKEQVQEMLRLQLGLETAPEPADAADALATAVCHLAHRRTEALVGAAGPPPGASA